MRHNLAKQVWNDPVYGCSYPGRQFSHAVSSTLWPAGQVIATVGATNRSRVANRETRRGAHARRRVSHTDLLLLALPRTPLLHGIVVICQGVWEVAPGRTPKNLVMCAARSGGVHLPPRLPATRVAGGSGGSINLGTGYGGKNRFRIWNPSPPPPLLILNVHKSRERQTEILRRSFLSFEYEYTSTQVDNHQHTVERQVPGTGVQYIN